MSETERVAREYGKSGRTVVTLHGGPAAPGSMAPVARGLADSFRVIEPFQRGSGVEPLTVARHVADLEALIESRELDAPAIVGSSWGAMLALAYAAEHPERRCPLVLIGCGTFDQESRAALRATIEERTTDDLRARLAQVAAEVRDPDERMRRQGDLVTALYSYDLASSDLEVEHCDARAFEETWNDMVRLQTEGVYPGAFASIEAPVLMLHGARDPHPGRLVRRSLGRYVPQLEYVEWEPCGHYPWLERDVREDFFDTLRAWLGEHA